MIVLDFMRSNIRGGFMEREYYNNNTLSNLQEIEVDCFQHPPSSWCVDIAHAQLDKRVNKHLASYYFSEDIC